MMIYRQTSLCFVATLLLMGSSHVALGWGKIGHRVTGQIAEQYLSYQARAEIAAILGVEDLAESSSWADFMRSSPDAFWQREAGPYHYVTIPKGKKYREVGAPLQGDGISAMEQFRATLRDESASLEDKQLALRFLVHIIGDLHQPLHAGDGTDRGGNDYAVTFFGNPTNLHRVWDTDLVRHEELSFSEMAEWLNRRVTPAEVEAWSDLDPATWVDESAAIRDEIYPGGDREIRWDYIHNHRAIWQKRLTQAGVRTALYLNDVFSD